MIFKYNKQMGRQTKMELEYFTIRISIYLVLRCSEILFNNTSHPLEFSIDYHTTVFCNRIFI